MGYVFAGYSIAFVTLGTYALWVIRRGRQLTRMAPPEDGTA